MLYIYIYIRWNKENKVIKKTDMKHYIDYLSNPNEMME